MIPIFICYAKCTTCQKAKKWLEAHDIAFEERPIKEQHPTADELRDWQKISGLPVRKFFNTSGMLYREMELTKKLPGMTEEEMLALLATDGMLVKRPLLIAGNKVLVGFQEKEWEKTLK
ncbi:MAG: arsenate reductase family protein [Clostridia bacterium]|nr:arsenate reductase family protein [Clostridia bacterium]